MTTAHRISNLAGVLVPFAAFLVAVVLLWNTLVDWSDLAVLAAMYVICGFAVTVGFHRMLTHRSFQSPKWVQYALGVRPRQRFQGRAARALVRPHGLAVRPPGPGRLPPVRQGPRGGPGLPLD